MVIILRFPNLLFQEVRWAAKFSAWQSYKLESSNSTFLSYKISRSSKFIANSQTVESNLSLRYLCFFTYHSILWI